VKILLATDLSDSGTGASDLAAAFSRRSGQPIVLLHVWQPPARLVAQAVDDVPAFERTLRERSLTALDVQAERMRARGLSVETRLGQGEAAEGIAELAREIGASLIVVGSHGRRGLDRMLLGSVAHEVVLLADRPVLVARGGAAPSGIGHWAAGDRPLRVALAVDRSAASGAAADWVGQLGHTGSLEVRLVHVHRPLVETAQPGLPQEETGQIERETALERELRAFLGAFLDARKMPVKLRLSTARPGAVVASEADPASTDLLVLGTNQRSRLRRLWLGSTTELALRRARVPVVCVPAVSSQVLDETAREEIGKEDADDLC
jgi:nucleotide-binding universal stress UspA family protein